MSEHEAHLQHTCACIHDGHRVYSACLLHIEWSKQNTGTKLVSLEGEVRGLKAQLNQAREKLREYEQRTFLNL